VRAIRLAVVLVAALAVSGSVAPASSADEAGSTAAPVASLEPAKTAALWRSLVSTQPREVRAQAACRSLRAVFYAASDWLRLATKLAATQSPCAEYYVSVPPLVADKTQFRRDQAWRIRALGPSFHALAEIHFATWSRWVSSTGNSWYAAGVTARERMAGAGYDVAQGDSWMLNELTAAAGRGDGNARTNVRELLRGLYEGDGTRPTRGAVLVIGFGQRTGDLSAYQNTIQNWLADTVFWTDVARYVSDWSQEVYGDIRAYAVPGQPTSVRREYLNDYLQHKLVLVDAGPSVVEAARTYLREAYSPLANAAWPRETAWGWTMVPFEQMGAYISAQVDAMRWFSASTGQPRDHWGFAWAPRNTTGLSTADFASQTGQLLDRLASAIRDSENGVDPDTSGTGACGPPGQDALCAIDLAEARYNEAWRSFRAWTQSILSIGPASPIRLVAGVASQPLELSLASAVARPVAVTLGSTSSAGMFSTSPAGPWTSTLNLAISSGSVVPFHYRDTRAGIATLTASAPGTTPATRDATVVPGSPAQISVMPASRKLRARGLTTFTATTTDSFGNVTPANLSWSATPTALATFVGGRGGTATFRAGRVLGSGTVTATTSRGSVGGSATVVVTPATLRIRTATFRSTPRGVDVRLAAVDGARRAVSRATLTLVAYLEGRRVVRMRAATGAAGKASFRMPLGRGCFSLVVTHATAHGFLWDGRAPRLRVCR
jgi:hypothetical protein